MTQRRIAKFKKKRQLIVMGIWSVVFLYYSLTSAEVKAGSIVDSNIRDDYYSDCVNSLCQTSRSQAASHNDNPAILFATEPEQNCTSPAIEEFPRDLFTAEQRRQGYLVVHIFASIYIYYGLAMICDDYFVPCIECICEDFHLSSDVAGATFMAAAASSPELFTNMIGTFITKSDFGVGTIVGSAVFNILGVCAVCGICAKTALPLEWYPLTRDCFFYSASVGLLIVFMRKQEIFWYEALVLLLFYAVYIFVLCNDKAIKKRVESFVARMSTKFRQIADPEDEHINHLPVADEKTPLLGGSQKADSPIRNKDPDKEDTSTEIINDQIITSSLQSSQSSQAQEDGTESKGNLTRMPFRKGAFRCLLWLITWPARFAFAFTVPDCQKSNVRKFYPITMVMCILWIGVLSYIVNWMMTIIGYTLSIPDSVMGITFIAAGTSVPEIVTSIIVVQQGDPQLVLDSCPGLGSMGISSSIGSNTFDILVCLGLPWLVQGILISSEPINYVKINSAGLGYSVSTLLLSLVVLYSVLACNGFYLNKKAGFIALGLYCCFLVFASLFEMNIFYTVNLPTCNSDY